MLIILVYYYIILYYYLERKSMKIAITSKCLLYPKVFTPMLSGKPIDEEKLAKDYETLDKTLGVMEMMFLKNKQFLCADTISIADIMAVSEVSEIIKKRTTGGVRTFHHQMKNAHRRQHQ